MKGLPGISALEEPLCDSSFLYIIIMTFYEVLTASCVSFILEPSVKSDLVPSIRTLIGSSSRTSSSLTLRKESLVLSERGSRNDLGHLESSLFSKWRGRRLNFRVVSFLYALVIVLKSLTIGFEGRFHHVDPSQSLEVVLLPIYLRGDVVVTDIVLSNFDRT